MSRDLSCRGCWLPTSMPRFAISLPSLFCSGASKREAAQARSGLSVDRGLGPVVVDVKPARRLADPKVAFTFGWTRQVVEERGWRFRSRRSLLRSRVGKCQIPRFGYRRSSLFSLALLERVRAEVVDGASLGHAFECLPGESPSYVKSAVLHLLWRRELQADLTEPLSGRTLLRRLP